MSIANLTSAQAKEYLNLNVNDVNVGGELSGGIASGTFTPVITDESMAPAAINNVQDIVGRWDKINNLVMVHVLFTADTIAGNPLKYDITPLPVPKTSSFSSTDPVIGNASFFNNDSPLAGLVGSSLPQEIKVFQTNAGVNRNVQNFVASYQYTTD